MNKENNDIALFKKTISSMVVRKISYYRVIVSLCLFMFLLSPVFGDENSAVSFDKELSEKMSANCLQVVHENRGATQRNTQELRKLFEVFHIIP